VLQQFQDGYDRRDPTLIQDFRGLLAPEAETEVIGTGAVHPGDDEWCLGQDASCKLFSNDWESWGDLSLEIAEARISVVENVAWLSTTGVVKMEIDPDEACRDYLDYLKELTQDEEAHPRERLIEFLRGGSNTLFEAERGRQYIWPLRFTAVLERRAERWLFRQIQFSFATTRFPDVRNV
jgi:hypothetical protein